MKAAELPFSPCNLPVGVAARIWDRSQGVLHGRQFNAERFPESQAGCSAVEDEPNLRLVSAKLLEGGLRGTNRGLIR